MKSEFPKSKIDECESCSFHTKLTRYDNKPFPVGEDRWKYLCDVCANTNAGNAQTYPEFYENKTTLESMSYCTNLILEALKKRRIDGAISTKISNSGLIRWEDSGLKDDEIIARFHDKDVLIIPLNTTVK